MPFADLPNARIHCDLSGDPSLPTLILSNSLGTNSSMWDRQTPAFEKYFCVLKQYCALREGEEFLTADIEIELSAYSRDELSCAGYVILARNTG